MSGMMQISQMKDQEIANIVSGVENSQLKLTMNHLIRIRETSPELSRQDFENYITKAQLSGANPLKDQIYLIPFKTCVKTFGKPDQWVTRGNVIYSYHFFISKAEATKKYDGFEVEDGIGDYFDPVKSEVVKQPYAICRVYRKDREHPTEYKAWLPEFAKYNKDKVTLTSAWKKYMVMLQKCATCNAHRLAFPEDLGFMHTDIDEQIRVVDDAAPITNEEKNDSITTTAKEVKEEIKTEGNATIEDVEKDDVKKEDIETTAKQVNEEPYYIPFGPMQDRDIKEVPHVELKGFYNYVSGQMEERKKEKADYVIPEQAQEFLDCAKAILEPKK